MKKIISIILLLLLTTYNISFAQDLTLSGEGAILIDRDTGQILYEKNSHLKLQPASTTKIMTGILAIENGNMDDIATVDEEIVKLTDGSHIALEPGERLKFKDLLYALLIESANDSALVIAKHISGSIDEFVKLMNDKAKEIGALNTNFVNPNGLSDENHLTTAYDLSLMAKYAMENDTFRQIVCNYTYIIPKTNKKDEERYLKSANKLLYSNQKIDVDGKMVPIKYESVNGVKTGYTSVAKNCLVASAERGNQRLIAVVLKANGREVFSDIHKLLNYGFNNYEKDTIAFENQFIDNIEVIDGVNPLVAGIVKNNFSVCIPKDSIDKIERKVLIDEVKAPIKKGQTLGKIEYYLEDELLGQTDIVSTLNIEKEVPLSLSRKILSKWYAWLIAALFLLLFMLKLSNMTNRKQRKKRRAALYKSHDS